LQLRLPLINDKMILGNIFKASNFIKTNIFPIQSNKLEINVKGTRIIRSISVASFFVMKRLNEFSSNVLVSRTTNRTEPYIPTNENKYSEHAKKRSKSVDSIKTSCKF
jgi:hypothetical protein